MAAAKINWGLAIIGTRPDGYHLLRSVMQSVALYDNLYFCRAAEDSCQMGLSVAEDANLALRAWRLMKRQYGLPGGLAIRIEKNIPAGGGLAGGSADGAATLQAVNQLFSLGLSAGELANLGLRLGADFPFCLQGGAALVEGIGEILTPLQPKESQLLLLANPGISVATPKVFALFDQLPACTVPDIAALAQGLMNGDPQMIAEHMANMLEPAAFALAPQVQALHLALQKQGLHTVMSGSGATVIGWSADARQTKRAATALSGQVAWVRLVNTIVS